MTYILDPTSRVAIRNVRAADRSSDLRGKVVGLLGNGVGATPEVLTRLGEILTARFGVSSVLLRQRPSLSRPTPGDMIEELVHACDAVIAGCGF